MSFVERSIILCPYLGGSTIGGSTVYHMCRSCLLMLLSDMNNHVIGCSEIDGNFFQMSKFIVHIHL